MPATFGRIIKRTVATALAVLVVCVGFAVFTGHAVVSYASSGSMEPAIGTFDVFFVNPFPGRIEAGDIIVFHSVSRAEPAVHRVVGGDSSGWFTRGDANPEMDQMAGEPVVTRDRLMGRVLTWPNGAPILVPEGGVTLIEARVAMTKLEDRIGGGDAATATLFLGLAIALGGASLFQRKPLPVPRGTPSRRARSALRALFPRGILGWHVAAAFTLVVLAMGAGAMTRAAHDTPVTLIVVQDPDAADGHRAAAPGQVAQREMRVGSLGALPTLVVVEDDGARVWPRESQAYVGSFQSSSVQLEQRAGDVVGLQEDTVRVWRYPAILPDAWNRALHDAAPGTPYLALAMLFAAPAWMIASAFRALQLPVGGIFQVREDWL